MALVALIVTSSGAGLGGTAGLVRESRELIAASKVLCGELKRNVAEMKRRMATTLWLLSEFDDVMAIPPCGRALGDDRPLPGRLGCGLGAGEAAGWLANDNWPVKIPRAT